jgi:hypothetical protein
MDSKKIQNKPESNKPAANGNKQTAKYPTVKQDFLDKLDAFLLKRINFFFWLGTIFTVLFTFLLFELKVSPGGDDSAYVLKAYDLIKEFKYPSFQGPLYPFVLAPFVAIFGVNLPLLKILSAIFIVIANIYFFKAFKNRIPASLLVFAFIIISYNYFVLYFGSQTYNEAFFMMLQAIFFYHALKSFTTDEQIAGKRDYLIIGLLLFLMCLTKNVAFAAVIGLIIYLAFTKKWKSILYSLGGFLVYFVPWEILKRILWKADAMQFSNQGSMLMYKDFYNQSRGKEDFWGLLQRVFDNSNLYLSKHLYRFLGLRTDPENEVMTILPILTIITVALFLVALYFVYRKNKPLLLTTIYTGCMLLVSFVSLQKHWDQWRLVIIYFPFMLLMIFAALYYLLKTEQLKNINFLMPAIGIILMLTSFKITSNNVKVQTAVLSENLAHNKYYGLTPDWQNYLQMSEWAAKNVPGEYMIACRKPEISFIYTERKFYGIMKVPASTLDSIFKDKTDSLVYTMIHLKPLTLLPHRPDLKYCKYLQGIVSGEFALADTTVDDSNFAGIYAMPKSVLDEMRNDPLIKGVAKEVPDAKTWIQEQLKKDADISITKPDELYNLLKKSKVKYAILASLRLNPNVYTGNIITTLHRYLYFIQLKYPENFREVQKFGEDESSTLIEIKLD